MARRGGLARKLLLGILVGAGMGLAGLYGFYRLAPASAQGTGGPNALWAGHRWVGQTHGAADYDDLVAQLHENAITDVFFHVGPLGGDGLIPAARYPNAAALVSQIKQRDPALTLQAWIGQVERRGGGPLDIADPATRRNIVGTAEAFLDLGFDGIHYNIEPIRSGDRNILTLLEETARVTRARGRILSIAGYETSLFPGSDSLVGAIHENASLWSADYYRKIARHCDQIAVMMYDTALPFDWLYGTLVAWQTRLLSDTIDDATVLFMGVPSYEDRRFTFRPEAENVSSSLRGIKIGLWNRPPRMPFGTAIYARWTTDDAEWETYRREWLGNP